MELQIPDSVIQLIASIRTQADIVSAISGAGMGFVLLTWLRTHGMSMDINLTGFRRPELLVVPLGLFLGAYLFGYVQSSLMSGYFAEIASGYNTSAAHNIFDAREHFLEHYFKLLQLLGGCQLFLSVIGIIALAVWFLVNLWSLSAERRGT